MIGYRGCDDRNVHKDDDIEHHHISVALLPREEEASYASRGGQREGREMKPLKAQHAES